MIHFIGTSYAAVILKEAARRRGLMLTEAITNASLVFVSEDTPTDENGYRDLGVITDLLDNCPNQIPIVLTSQVPPGFTRSYFRSSRKNFIYHQAETLRIEDGIQRAMYPEMFIVGMESRPSTYALDYSYQEYLDAFDCPVFRVSYEEAEFAKIAINATLTYQIEGANYLSKMAEKCGADWGKIAQILRHDSRIGKYSYLTPGRWQDSKHLLRDMVTLKEMDK